jgi:hypothetical protein
MIKLNIEVESSIGIDMTEKVRIKKMLGLIPTKIAQSLIDKEYTIRINNHKNMNRGTGGFYNKVNKLICLRAYFESYVLYHEIGHFVDMENKYVSAFSDTQLFLEIYAQEKRSLDKFIKYGVPLYRHCIETTHEYFAQSFAHYILYGEQLKEYAPYTHKFISRCIEII